MSTVAQWLGEPRRCKLVVSAGIYNLGYICINKKIDKLREGERAFLSTSKTVYSRVHIPLCITFNPYVWNYQQEYERCITFMPGEDIEITSLFDMDSDNWRLDILVQPLSPGVTSPSSTFTIPDIYIVYTGCAECDTDDGYPVTQPSDGDFACHYTTDDNVIHVLYCTEPYTNPYTPGVVIERNVPSMYNHFSPGWTRYSIEDGGAGLGRLDTCIEWKPISNARLLIAGFTLHEHYYSEALVYYPVDNPSTQTITTGIHFVPYTVILVNRVTADWLNIVNGVGDITLL